MVRSSICLGALLLLSACGGGDGDDDDPGNGPVGPICAPDEFAIEGTLDGEAVSAKGTLAGHAWVNGVMLAVPFDGGGEVNLDFDAVVADGESAMVTGNITLPPAVPHAGETVTSAAGSMTKLDNGVSYSLQDLSLSVQCVTAPCPAQPIEGTLMGCVDWTR